MTCSNQGGKTDSFVLGREREFVCVVCAIFVGKRRGCGAACGTCGESPAGHTGISSVYTNPI